MAAAGHFDDNFKLQVVLLAEKLQQIDNERKSRRAAAKS
jgi:hypothetical protein